MRVVLLIQDNAYCSCYLNRRSVTTTIFAMINRNWPTHITILTCYIFNYSEIIDFKNCHSEQYNLLNSKYYLRNMFNNSGKKNPIKKLITQI